jgi:hypothetical protein
VSICGWSFSTESFRLSIVISRRSHLRRTHFLLKGLEKVRTEWSLITLVYSLKRVLNLVSFQKLMAAVR